MSEAEWLELMELVPPATWEDYRRIREGAFSQVTVWLASPTANSYDDEGGARFYSETPLTRRHLARAAFRARSLATGVPAIDRRGRLASFDISRLIVCIGRVEPHTGQIITLLRRVQQA